jgi:hypothetical protein
MYPVKIETRQGKTIILGQDALESFAGQLRGKLP